MIQQSLATVGAGRSITIDDEGIVRAGEGTVRAARKLGFRLKVIDTDAKTLIAVRRRDLTPAQKTALALFDNRTAELGEWDADMLELLAQQGLSLEPFFTEEDLKILLLKEDEGTPHEVDPNAADEVRHVTCPKCGKKFPV